jgi:hypothetical protein
MGKNEVIWKTSFWSVSVTEKTLPHLLGMALVVGILTGALLTGVVVTVLGLSLL